MTKKKRKHEPGICPKCGSEAIDYGSFDIGGAYYEATCEGCGCEFQECYELKFVENIITEPKSITLEEAVKRLEGGE